MKLELMYNLTEDLLIIMEDTDVSKKELGRRIGKSKLYVKRILSGKKEIRLDILCKIATALNVKLSITVLNAHS